MTRARDTIVAVSSPPGRSARGLVRVAGPRALAVVGRLLASPPDALATHHLHPVRLLDPPIPAMLSRFPAARSYSGDETIELQLPGNPALLDRTLHRCIAAGARLAEPGEFTFRAFLAGRIDLTQAEGIAATIAATSHGQLRAATLLREGKLGGLAASLVDRLGTQLALVEAGIDFTDQEDVVPVAPGVLDANLGAVEAELAILFARSRSWSVLEALPRVVMVGPPSSGKSTLFNALLGRQRAVVSPLPGTTRDVLAEALVLDLPGRRRVEVMLVDIAGLDEPAARLDREAQAAARRAIQSADLVLLILDPTQAAASFTESAASTLTVATKADLQQAPADVGVSAVTGGGLDALRAAIADRVGERGVTIASDVLALQPRHEAALRDAMGRLEAARGLLAGQRDSHAIDDIELVADALRAALDALTALGGQLTPDDIIGRVFATFCVGK